MNEPIRPTAWMRQHILANKHFMAVHAEGLIQHHSPELAGYIGHTPIKARDVVLSIETKLYGGTGRANQAAALAVAREELDEEQLGFELDQWAQNEPVDEMYLSMSYQNTEVIRTVWS